MKIQTTIATALSLGLLSAATVARADSTVQIGGTTYNEVFITGSTAARGNVFHAVDTAHSGGGVFDSIPTFVTLNNGPAPTTSTGAYTAYGTISGTPYCLCFDFSGSEAGLWALQRQASGIPNPVQNALGTNSTAVIPGTPEPTGFIDPNTANAFTADADLSMADTSQAVSLSPAPPYTALHDYGIVGAVTFEWCKGKNSNPTAGGDTSWTDLTNVTDPQLNYLLSSSQIAFYFTGNTNDQDDVYPVGRNKASGTHQNTMLDTLHGTTVAVNQYVVSNCTYSASGALTAGSIEAVSTAGGIVSVGNDGFDSGGSVATELSCDEASAKDSFGYQIIMLGYVGISDATTAIGNGAAALRLNGVPENDETVENGTYSFWGHEHLYGTASEDAAVEAVGTALGGTNPIHSFGAGTPNGALENAGQLGGGEANPGSTQSTIIAPQFMQADKPSGSDAGYSAPLL